MLQVDKIESKRIRMPAEWVPHEATWISWPHNPDTWPGLLSAAEAAMAEVVAAIARSEHVHINVLDQTHRAHVSRQIAANAPAEHLTFHEIASNDAWIRDYGPIFVLTQSGARTALDFEFNAWGGKYPPWDLDQKAAAQIARALHTRCERPGMVLEGGSIDVNGAGCLLTTEQCLLNPNRNPTLTRREIEDQLQTWLGVDQIVWLGSGVAGDDTDGHVDDIARFVDEETIAAVVERNVDDPNFAPLDTNRRRLEALQLDGRAAASVVELPMPAAIFAGAQRLPASYANFYIANEVVLVPVFDDAADDEALTLLGDCFPTRTVVPIASRALIQGLGGIHCLTQQVPAAVAQL